MKHTHWPTFEDILLAYEKCRLGKSASSHQIAFEVKLGENILKLHKEIHRFKYKPSRSVCFIVTYPKLREIFAAHIRDRIVHHLIESRLQPFWEKKFIDSSFACRKGKGTHGALRYLQNRVRSLSRGGAKEVWALQLDISSFFATIHRPTLSKILLRGVQERKLKWLIGVVYGNDARVKALLKGDKKLFSLIPKEKSWFFQPKDCGLPIGNLTSQFGANVYLSHLDHYIQRQIKPGAYLRYMDDLTLLDSDPKKLSKMIEPVSYWLEQNRLQSINQRKTKLSPLSRGIHYLGYKIRMTENAKQPLQLLPASKKKWQWVKELRILENTNLFSKKKLHPLAIESSEKELQKKVAKINSRLGYLKHARSYQLRRKSLDMFVHSKTEFAELPDEFCQKWCPVKIKKGYPSIKIR